MFYVYSQGGPLGFVTKLTADSQMKVRTAILDVFETARLQGIFEHSSPQFPTIEDTIAIIEHFMAWVRYQPPNNDGVGFGNQFKKHGRSKKLLRLAHLSWLWARISVEQHPCDWPSTNHSRSETAWNAQDQKTGPQGSPQRLGKCSTNTSTSSRDEPLTLMSWFGMNSSGLS